MSKRINSVHFIYMLFLIVVVSEANAELLSPREAAKQERLSSLRKVLLNAGTVQEKTKTKCLIAALDDNMATDTNCDSLISIDQSAVNRNDARGVGDRIVNGIATVGHPFVGALTQGISKASANQLCTGTMISDSQFLTAAHCVTRPKDADVYFVFLQHFGFFEISKIEVPEDYHSIGKEADLAVLTLACRINGLKSSIKLNESVGKIPYGRDGKIVGFGRTGGTIAGGAKQDYGIKREGYIVSEKCPAGFDREKHICWKFNGGQLDDGRPSSNTCNADSGGPLFDNFDSNLLLGVTTGGKRARDCGTNDNSWDLNIFTWQSWLREKQESSSNLPHCIGSDFSSRSIVGETKQMGPDRPKLVYNIETDTKVVELLVSMNGEDNGSGKNNFDLRVINLDGPEGSKTMCEKTGSGQFASCRIKNPNPGKWRIEIVREAGAGLVQTVVVRSF